MRCAVSECPARQLDQRAGERCLPLLNRKAQSTVLLLLLVLLLVFQNQRSKPEEFELIHVLLEILTCWGFRMESFLMGNGGGWSGVCFFCFPVKYGIC